MFSINAVTGLTPFYSFGPSISKTQIRTDESQASRADAQSPQASGRTQTVNDPSKVNETAFDRIPGTRQRTALDDLQDRYQSARFAADLLGSVSDARTIGTLVDVRA